jgi:hypothetical protein
MSLQRAWKAVPPLFGPDRECWEGIAEVERLRFAWRPERVRLLLFAESHVWTPPEEAALRVRQPDGTETGFVRFVYCLGYGDNELVDGIVAKNRGTPQFWRLFHDVLDGPETPREFPQVAGMTKRERQRVGKLVLLHRLRAAGIWLVDASIVALSRGRERVSAREYGAALKASWCHHIGDVVSKARPDGVLVIGKGVYRACEGRLREALGAETPLDVIPQPNGCRAPGRLLESRARSAAFARKILGLPAASV